MTDGAREDGRNTTTLAVELKAALKDSSNDAHPPEHFRELLNRYRASVKETTLAGQDFDRIAHAHASLWAAHSSINGFCRKGLTRLRRDSTRPVETRKYVKSYLEFLKDSEKFYRAIISDLHRLKGPIRGIEQITGVSASSTSSRDPAYQKPVDDICYQSLISLGDLCRWRASEKLDQQPSWRPAVGYYNLAAAFQPFKGAAFHQRAFVDLGIKDHFRAVFYFYRSIVVDVRFPNAIDNLGHEMKSLRKRWGTEELDPKTNVRDARSSHRLLQLWWLRLQSLCYVGEEIPGHSEMEGTYLTHLAAVTKLPESNSFLSKLVLATMAAERTTLLRLNDADPTASDRLIQAFSQYHRLNVQTITALSRILIKEISGSGHEKSEDQKSAECTLSITVLNILPSLRLYHHYLLGNYQFLLADDDDEENAHFATDLWACLVELYNVMARGFPLDSVPELLYPFDEDITTIGFSPIRSEVTRHVWFRPDGTWNVGVADAKPSAHSDQIEALARIRDIRIKGLHLSMIEELPVKFSGEHFHFRGQRPGASVEDAPQAADTSIPDPIQPLFKRPSNDGGIELHGSRKLSNSKASHHEAPYLDSPFKSVSAGASRGDDDEEEEEGDEASQEQEAKRMVDDLVGPDDSPRENGSSRPVSALDARPLLRSPSAMSSFAPTPPSARVGGPRLGRSQAGSSLDLVGHSPLLFGSGGVWSPNGNGRPKNGSLLPNC